MSVQCCTLLLYQPFSVLLYLLFCYASLHYSWRISICTLLPLAISIYFRKPQYKLDDKNDVLRHRPEWVITGRAGFVFNVTVLEVDGTATGKNCDLYLHRNDWM